MGKAYRNPPTAVDMIIEVYDEKTLTGIVLIQRKNEPFKGKWALPGGFQEFGESLEDAAVREAKEETGLDIVLLDQLSAYSDPDRDPRGHVNSVGYVARAFEEPVGGDDAAEAKIFPVTSLPELAFDHLKRIQEYLTWTGAQGTYKRIQPNPPRSRH